jgi:hypothetical protein
LHDFHWRHVYPLYKSYVQAIKDSGADIPAHLDKSLRERAVREAYRRSAGEVEANNTMARADWDAARRREAAPEQTQTVPTAQQIVDVNGLPTQYKGKNGLAPDTVQRVRDLRANGMGATEIAQSLKIARASVYRVLSSAEDAMA